MSELRAADVLKRANDAAGQMRMALSGLISADVACRAWDDVAEDIAKQLDRKGAEHDR